MSRSDLIEIVAFIALIPIGGSVLSAFIGFAVENFILMCGIAIVVQLAFIAGRIGGG